MATSAYGSSFPQTCIGIYLLPDDLRLFCCSLAVGALSFVLVAFRPTAGASQYLHYGLNGFETKILGIIWVMYSRGLDSQRYDGLKILSRISWVVYRPSLNDYMMVSELLIP